MSKDPLTITYDKILEEFKRDYRNVIDYNTTRNPKPDKLTEAHVPELCVLPDTATIKLGNASCESTIDQTFTVAVATGNQRLGEIAFPTMWKLMRTYWRLRYGELNSLNALEYNGRSFIEDCWTERATYELGAAERGMYGWSCLWPIVVRMSFSTEDLSA